MVQVKIMLQKSTVKFDITADASDRIFAHLFRAVEVPSANQYSYATFGGLLGVLAGTIYGNLYRQARQVEQLQRSGMTVSRSIVI